MLSLRDFISFYVINPKRHIFSSEYQNKIVHLIQIIIFTLHFHFIFIIRYWLNENLKSRNSGQLFHLHLNLFTVKNKTESFTSHDKS